MRIALLNQPVNPLRFPLRGDSIGIWHYQVATRLARLGYGQPVVYSRGAGLFAWKRRTLEGGIFIDVPAGLDRRLESFRDRLSPTRSHARPERPSYAASSHFALYALRAALDMRRRGIEAVAVHNYSQFAPIIRRVLPNARIILHMNCYWLSQIDSEWIEPRVSACDGVNACSNAVASAVAERFPSVASRCRTVYNGVDSTRFTPPTEPRREQQVLLFVGRVSPEKGVHTMLEAFERIADRHPLLRLRIIGPQTPARIEYVVLADPDPLVQSLRGFWEGTHTYIDQLRERLPAALADRVEFVDQIPNSELIEEYRSASLLLFPSVWEEPFGIGNVEAMACGTPVVGTRGGGIPEIIDDGRTGRLVARGDVGDLARAIDELMSDPVRLAEMGKAARIRAEQKFDWDRVAHELHASLAGIDASHP